MGPGEVCDDGNLDNTDECLNTCLFGSCGDGFVGPNEACDDGNIDNTDLCLNTCVLASCGDGFVGPGESKDDADENTDTCDYGVQSCTVCSTLCQTQAGVTTFCGDGVLQPGDGEVCDDGGEGRCLNNCSECGPLFTGDGCNECTAGINFALPLCAECAARLYGENCEPLEGLDNGIYYDSASRLQWESCAALGGVSTCSGDRATLGLTGALSYCEGLNWGSYTDWRLPTVTELQTLIRGCTATSPGSSCGIT